MVGVSPRKSSASDAQCGFEVLRRYVNGFECGDSNSNSTNTHHGAWFFIHNSTVPSAGVCASSRDAGGTAELPTCRRSRGDQSHPLFLAEYNATRISDGAVYVQLLAASGEVIARRAPSQVCFHQLDIRRRFLSVLSITPPAMNAGCGRNSFSPLLQHAESGKSNWRGTQDIRRLEPSLRLVVLLSLPPCGSSAAKMTPHRKPPIHRRDASRHGRRLMMSTTAVGGWHSARNGRSEQG